MPLAMRIGPATIEFLVIPSRYKTALPPRTSPTAMIQSMSGNNLKYHSNHALPTTIRVMGKPAFLMNPPRQTLDQRSPCNWADKKIPEFIAISQRRLLMMRQICRMRWAMSCSRSGLGKPISANTLPPAFFDADASSKCSPMKGVLLKIFPLSAKTGRSLNGARPEKFEVRCFYHSRVRQVDNIFIY